MSTSKKPPQPRDRYDAAAVDRIFNLVRWFHDKGLSTPMYYASSTVLIPPYLVLFAMNRLKILGRERLPPRGTGFFLLSNHISMIDGQALALVTYPRTYWFPSKASFYRNTATGLAYTFATACKSFPVRRGERDQRAIDLMTDLLRKGESVLLFPAGTRSEHGELGEGRPGVGKIIHDVRPIVVPAYVEGLDRFLGRGIGLPSVGEEATIVFGSPLDMRNLYDLPSGPETSQAVVDRVMAAIGELRDDLHRAR